MYICIYAVYIYTHVNAHTDRHQTLELYMYMYGSGRWDLVPLAVSSHATPCLFAESLLDDRRGAARDSRSPLRSLGFYSKPFGSNGAPKQGPEKLETKTLWERCWGGGGVEEEL